MLKIRRIYDDILPVDKDAIGQVQEMLQARFPDLPDRDWEHLPEKLTNPLLHRFRTILFVVEKRPKQVVAFALLMHEPNQRFCYLDFIASDQEFSGRGIGGTLYERVRDEALRLNSWGIFFECLPDDPQDCPHPGRCKENAARLRFYERYGARPLANNAYNTPVGPDHEEPPYLVFDGLDTKEPLAKSRARKAVRAILERKYSYLSSQYVDKVVQSFRDDPVPLRDYRYRKPERPHRMAQAARHEQFVLTVNDKHGLHHVRQSGYVEAPVRIRSILAQIEPTEMFARIPFRNCSESFISAVHEKDFVDYLRRACAQVPAGKYVYPYVFPIRNAARPPRELSVRAGYYCIDTFTPLNRNAYLAARRAVACTLAAADAILKGRRVAYALVRPPGHHAESRSFGGFCYFNNIAVAAQHLSQYGKVAILDIDYHHGNGQQQIFYERKDVFTASIHGHPNFAYPYFSGFADEAGAGDGEGFNLNLPLPERQDGADYRRALRKAIQAVAGFQPMFLLIALGLDPAKGDPTGTWSLTAGDFEANGRLLGELNLPTLVVQEGGYRTRTLGVNARRFFTGLATEISRI